jgi:hypothetical protein
MRPRPAIASAILSSEPIHGGPCLSISTMRACSRAGAVKRRDVGFELHGPIEELSHLGGLWFWREAPGIGLTGVTQIKVGEHGVIGESVAYEGNLASDMLRRAAH